MLSFLLAAAMVFSMNSFAFGEETKETDVVYDGEAPDITSNTGSENGIADGYSDGFDYGWDDGYEGRTPDDYPHITPAGDDDYMNGYKEGYKEGYNDGYEAGREEAEYECKYTNPQFDPNTVKVELTPGTGKNASSVAKLEHVTDPVSWNSTRDGEALIETVLTGGTSYDQYLYMSKKIGVSFNGYNTNWNSGLQESYNTAYGPSASYNVIPLSDGYYLFMRYYLSEMNAAMVPGYDFPVPFTYFDGRKVDFNKSGLSKTTGSRRESLNIDAALVKYENGTVTEIPGAAVSGVKLDKKNNRNATVLWDSISVNRNNTTVYERPLVDGATIPTFSFSVKAKGDAKTQGKAIKNALKDKTYPFAIAQICVNTNIYDGDGIRYNPSDTDGNDLVTKTLSGNFQINAFVYSNADTKEGRVFTNAGPNLKVTKVTEKGASVTLPVDTWNGKTGGTADVKLDAKKDYSFSTGSIGGESVVVLDLPGKNIVYNENSGTLDGYKYAFRQSPKNNKLIRQGIYRDNSDGFVFSAD